MCSLTWLVLGWIWSTHKTCSFSNRVIRNLDLVNHDLRLRSRSCLIYFLLPTFQCFEVLSKLTIHLFHFLSIWLGLTSLLFLGLKLSITLIINKWCQSTRKLKFIIEFISQNLYIEMISWNIFFLFLFLLGKESSCLKWI